MLVLSRKPEEQIQIGNDITITIIKAKGKNVRIGIEAPKDMRIVRAELPRLDEVTDSETTLPLNDRRFNVEHPTSRCPNPDGCKSVDNETAGTTDNSLDHHGRRSSSTDRWTVTSMRQRVRMAQMAKAATEVE